jgi:hypothetical protein
MKIKFLIEQFEHKHRDKAFDAICRCIGSSLRYRLDKNVWTPVWSNLFGIIDAIRNET